MHLVTCPSGACNLHYASMGDAMNYTYDITLDQWVDPETGNPAPSPIGIDSFMHELFGPNSNPEPIVTINRNHVAWKPTPDDKEPPF